MNKKYLILFVALVCGLVVFAPAVHSQALPTPTSALAPRSSDFISKIINTISNSISSPRRSVSGQLKSVDISIFSSVEKKEGDLIFSLKTSSGDDVFPQRNTSGVPFYDVTPGQYRATLTLKENGRDNPTIFYMAITARDNEYLVYNITSNDNNDWGNFSIKIKKSGDKLSIEADEDDRIENYSFFLKNIALNSIVSAIGSEGKSPMYNLPAGKYSIQVQQQDQTLVETLIIEARRGGFNLVDIEETVSDPSVTRPTITKISSNSNPDFQFFPGDTVKIEGHLLADNGFIRIGDRFIQLYGKGDTQSTLDFTVPADLAPGNYDMWVFGPAIETNKVKVTVLARPTTVSTTCNRGYVLNGNGECIATKSFQTLKVVSPNTSVSLTSGQTYRIKWTGGTKKVEVFLLDEPTRLGNKIFSGIPNNGYVDWTVTPLYSLFKPGTDTKVTPSGKYVIWIGCVDNEYDCTVDDSDVPFTIKTPSSFPSPKSTATPSITVVTPNGGERFVTGQTYPIQWNTSDLPTGSRVSFQLSYRTQNGVTYEDGFDINPIPNTGVFNWTIPAKYANMQPNYFKLRAILAGPNIPDTNPPQDYSDNYFTITAPDKKYDRPTISRISSKGNVDFQFYPGDTIVIEGAYLANNGYIRIGDTSVLLKGDGVPQTILNFTTPSNLKPGTYDFYVHGPALTTNKVKVTVLARSVDSVPIPVANPSIIAEQSTISSGKNVRLRLSFPSNTTSANLYFACPSGVSTRTSPEICNTYVNVLSNTDWNPMFYNSTSINQFVRIIYNVRTSDGFNYSPSVQITVQPQSTTANIAPASTYTTPTTSSTPSPSTTATPTTTATPSTSSSPSPSSSSTPSPSTSASPSSSTSPSSSSVSRSSSGSVSLAASVFYSIGDFLDSVLSQ